MSKYITSYEGNTMFGLLKNKNRNLDIESLLKRAKENDRDAQQRLGLAYCRGVGVTKNIDKATYWLEKANEVDNREGDTE